LQPVDVVSSLRRIAAKEFQAAAKGGYEEREEDALLLAL
jgi:hypothetical protein